MKKQHEFGYIYKITNPTGRVYIGQTVNYERRMKSYAKGDCEKQPGIYNSIRKHGWEAHTAEIIETIAYDKEGLDEIECKWITHFNSYHRGLNCTSGGKQEDRYGPGKTIDEYPFGMMTVVDSVVRYYATPEEAAIDLDIPLENVLYDSSPERWARRFMALSKHPSEEWKRNLELRSLAPERKQDKK